MRGALSLRVSVIALALSCVVAAQAVSFVILLTFPGSAPSPVTAAAVAAAFRAPKSVDEAGLTRREVETAPFAQDRKRYTRLAARTVQALLTAEGVREVRVHSLSDSVSMQTDGPPPISRIARVRDDQRNVGDIATAPFPSFATALQRRDGRWTVVEPQRALVSPENLRIAVAFGLSAFLLGPLTWWSARRLTRPLQVLASASQTFGRNPGAPPLVVAGPREVREASAAFNAMQADVARHIDERATLMAAIAHDLRTPLTSLRIRAESAPEAERRRMAADIGRMEALIANLLLFVRGGRVESHRESVDLAELVRDVADDAKVAGGCVELTASVRTIVLADPAALRRVVENLVQNAVAYAGAADLRVGHDDDWAWTDVADQGPGIPPDAVERVFKPFVRLETSRSRDTGGVGLGLAIARSIARSHGGDIKLIQREPRGLIARLIIPITNDCLGPPGNRSPL